MRDINGEGLAKDLPVMPVSGGKLRGDVDIMSQGRELDVFFGQAAGYGNRAGGKGPAAPPEQCIAQGLAGRGAL